MSAFTPPFRSAIFYSVQNEDYAVELAVLAQRRRAAPARVLLIASSGENALSLLTQPSVAAVWAVDTNPAQLRLTELRRTAAETLTPAEQLQLLGAGPAPAGAAGAAERLALYDWLRPRLPDADRAFWDERRDLDLAFGVHHTGRNDELMHLLQDQLAAAGLRPLAAPLPEAALPAWVAVYRAVMTPAYIREVFGLPSEALAARIAGIAAYLGECHFRFAQAPGAERNPFVTTVFANAYAHAAGDAGLPLYLQVAGHAALRRLGTHGRLHLHAGNVLEQLPVLAAAHGPFDLISLSNIADWMTPEQFTAAAQLARDCLAPGGAFLARTATGSRAIQDLLGAVLPTEAAFNAHLAAVERGPWFRTHAAGFRA